MRAELVAVGRELLLGESVDTNAAWISERLAEVGIDVRRHTTVGDVPESGVAERLDALINELEDTANPTIALLASRGEPRVRVTARADSREAALVLLDPVVERVIDLLGAHVVRVDDEAIEAAIGRQLRVRGLALAIAESITGGGVASRIVSVAGSSGWFRGGLVTYATDTKVSLGGVDPDVLRRDGPVAESVAGQLATGAARRLGADVGLGIVGVAGPTRQGGQDIGTCCVAVMLPDGLVRTNTVHLPGRTRRDVQEFAASAALSYLCHRLAE